MLINVGRSRGMEFFRREVGFSRGWHDCLNGNKSWKARERLIYYTPSKNKLFHCRRDDEKKKERKKISLTSTGFAQNLNKWVLYRFFVYFSDVMRYLMEEINYSNRYLFAF